MAYWICDCGKHVTVPCKKCECGVEWDDSRVLHRLSTATQAEAEDKLDSQSPVNSNAILNHLYRAGVIDGMDERVIIDLTVEQPARIYTQRFASAKFLNVLMGKPMLMALMKGETVEVESGDESCQTTEPPTG